MTQEVIRALSNDQLAQVLVWAHDEQKVRTERRKREVIAKIKQMAEEIGVSLSIAGRKGRPAVDRQSIRGDGQIKKLKGRTSIARPFPRTPFAQ